MNNDPSVTLDQNSKINAKGKCNVRNVTTLPKKISWKKKPFFPVGNHYKNYNNAQWKWIDVFEHIERLKSEGEYSYIRPISELYNIKYSTLRHRYTKWISSNKVDIGYENRGGSNKFFTKEQENMLYKWISDIYIKGNCFFDDECLRISAGKMYKEINKTQYNIYNFKVSKGWVYYFKEKWNLSSFVISKYRKVANIDDNLVKIFLNDCSLKCVGVPAKFILNLDETFWRTINGKLNVIGATGAGDRNLVTNIDQKQGFTGIFIIASNGDFWKPIVVMKGKTKRCLNKISGEDIDDSKLHKQFSNSGWITVDIMKFILSEISKFTLNEKSVLILDQYSVHKRDEIQVLALKYNISLIFVPSGRTAENQPLDVGVNGPIKSIGKKIIKEIYMADPFAKLTIKDSVKALIQSVALISRETVIKSFKKALHFQ